MFDAENLMKIGSQSHSIAQLILWSISKNGLEKTLEDLRRVTSSNIGKEPTQSIYEQFLGLTDTTNNILLEIEKARNK